MSKLRRRASSKVFVERPFYVEPPAVSDTASDDEKLKAWADWYEKDQKAKRQHKNAWTKYKKPNNMPNFDRAFIMVKLNGVWKQRPAMTSLVAGFNWELIDELLFDHEQHE